MNTLVQLLLYRPRVCANLYQVTELDRPRIETPCEPSPRRGQVTWEEMNILMLTKLEKCSRR